MTGIRVYRDSDGDLWAVTPDGRRWMGTGRGAWEGPATRDWVAIRDRYGPLVELSAAEAAKHTAAVQDLADRIRVGHDESPAPERPTVTTPKPPEPPDFAARLAASLITEATDGGTGDLIALGQPRENWWATPDIDRPDIIELDRHGVRIRVRVTVEVLDQGET